MKYIYFKSDKGNFGDDLNPWLWPKLFPNDQSNISFIGIGSILHDGNKSLKTITTEKTIVFGTGVRPSNTYKNFTISEDWDVKFLRGPLSAQSLNYKHEYITDAAYAIRQINDFEKYLNVEKKYKVSVMPYFHSVDFFDWKSICDKLGYNYISPYSEQGVEFTLSEIAASSYIITEAMHGAILADIMRVPWHRFILTTPSTEGERISDFKWNDWLQSIKIFISEPTYIPFYRKSFIHETIKNLTLNIIDIKFFFKPKVTKDILNKLSVIDKYYLSKNSTIEEIDSKIKIKIDEINGK